jgi:hypothetical protein
MDVSTISMKAGIITVRVISHLFTLGGDPFMRAAAPGGNGFPRCRSGRAC